MSFRKGQNEAQSVLLLTCFSMCCNANGVWSIHACPCLVVSMCHPRFIEVRCDWSIRVVLLWCVSQFWERSLELVNSRVTCASQFWRNLSVFTMSTVTGSSQCHLCSRATSGRKRQTVACYTSLRIFLGLFLPLLDCGNCRNRRCGRKRLIEPKRVKSWRTDFKMFRLRWGSCVWNRRSAAICFVHCLFPVRWEMILSWLAEGRLLELADNWIPAQCHLPPLFHEHDIFPLPCCPPSARVKGLRHTQQNERSNAAHDRIAVSCPSWLVGHKGSSLTPLHVELMDKKHSALWRHLCDEALQRQSTAPSERHRTDATLSPLLKWMLDHRISSSLRNWPSSRKRLFHSRRKCTTAWRGRKTGGIWRRNNSEWGGILEKSRRPRCLKSTMTQCSWGIKNCISHFTRCEIARCLVRDSVPAGPRWHVFYAKIHGRGALDVGFGTIERPLSASSWCATFVFCRVRTNRNRLVWRCGCGFWGRRGLNYWANFPSRLPHDGLRIPLSLTRCFFLSRSSSCTCVRNEWRNTRWTKSADAHCHLTMLVSAPHGLLLIPDSDSESWWRENLRRLQTALYKRWIDHTVACDRGASLMFVADEQGHRNPYVFVDNCESLCDRVTP